MGHGVRLLTQFQQGAGDAAGDVEKSQMSHLVAGVLQPAGQLSADGEQDVLGVGVQVVGEQLLQPLVGDLGDLAVGARANHDAAPGLGHEKPHFTDEIPLVEIGQNDLPSVVVLHQRGHRAVHDIEQDVGRVALVEDFGVLGIAAAMAG
jgi:hypothetical protein